MIIKRDIRWNGGSAYLLIPQDMHSYLGITDNRADVEVCMMIDTSKHGYYLAVWNEKQQTTQKEGKNVGL